MKKTSMHVPTIREMQLMVLVADEERCGHEVAELYKKETRKTISENVVYIVFKGLVRKGWIKMRDVHNDNHRIHYFHIMDAGRKALERGFKENPNLVITRAQQALIRPRDVLISDETLVS
jgi:DNA-binding PadR family transcriptional regulator